MKWLIILLCLFFVSCSQKVELDLKTDLEIRTNERFYESVNISYHSYRGKWTMDAVLNTGCGQVNLLAEDQTLVGVWIQMKEMTECFLIVCNEEA